MEVKEKSKKRELIKTLAIIFLAVLLVLTFFSNTIRNRSLPEVSTAMVESGSVSSKLRGSGTVSANERYEVVIDQTREVRTVCVKVGDTVEQGDLLFVLGDIESQELRDAEEQLDRMNRDYQAKLLNLSKEYGTEDLNISRIQERINEAAARRDANRVTDGDLSYIKGDIAAIESSIRQADYLIKELEQEKLQLDSDLAEYKAEVDKWTGEVEKLENRISELRASAGGVTSTTEIKQKLAEAEARKSAADPLRKEANTALSNAEKDENYIALVAEAKAEMMKAGVDITDSNKLEAYIQRVLSNAENENREIYKKAYDAVKSAETAYENACSEYDSAVQDIEIYSKQLQDAEAGNTSAIENDRLLKQAEEDLTAAKKKLSAAERELSYAGEDTESIQKKIDSYTRSNDALSLKKGELEAQLQTVESRKQEYDRAVEELKSASRELEDALNGKDIDKQLNNLDLSAAQKDIEKQKELVAKLTQGSVDTEVKANVSGTISAIHVSAGKDTTAGSPMAEIDVVDRGYTIRIPVTAEQARQVKVGDKADVTNYYWGNSVDATLENIAPDPDNPGRGRVLVFRVTGDVDAGSNLTLSIGQKSANFDAIVPKSALRQDSNGYFVLVVTSKNTPLGNRYYATRADVQVLAEDDTRAAVSGVSNMDYVITASTKPLDAGTMVRMVDDQ